MAAALGVPRGLQAPRIQESLRLPDLRDQLEKLSNANATYVREENMRRGDTIATLLKRAGLDSPGAQEFFRRDPIARNIYSLQPGQTLQVAVDQSNLLVSLQAELGGDGSGSRKLFIERVGDLDESVYQAHLQSVQNNLQYEMRSGSFGEGGFFNGMDALNVPDDVSQQLLSIFSGVIDFHHDIAVGDRVRVIYEVGDREGAIGRNGRVLAVELINRSHLYQALWYSVDGGKTGSYYTFDGRCMETPFLRSPVEFSRMSSGFGWRSHPLHHRWVEHKGIDFAAPTGTHVFATSDGTVDFVGEQTGYGNIVILKHKDGYSSYYAHLSGFADIRPGLRVRKGQLIGFVGQTGWATGPHLHYEVRFKQVPQNPLSVMLRDPVTLSGSARQQFLRYSSDMLSRIAVLRSLNVASNRN
jgi:murein DD-endopeptidase MepM/ murein hydrolase activator NlpD